MLLAPGQELGKQRQELRLRSCSPKEAMGRAINSSPMGLSASTFYLADFSYIQMEDAFHLSTFILDPCVDPK